MTSLEIRIDLYLQLRMNLQVFPRCSPLDQDFGPGFWPRILAFWKAY